MLFLSKKKNVIGKHFYRLTIINEAPPEFQKKKNCKLQKIRHVYCKCLCGNYVTVRLIGLKHGDTKSCGCVKKEQNNINISELKHGLSDHPLYYIWKNMIGRCTDVKNIRYNCYGARWISVCERWTDFELFFLDMNDGYLNGLSIERVDNDGNYEPKNCKWATRLEQANNTRRTWWVEYMGEKIAFSLACRQLGLDIEKVRKVMRKNNFDFDLFVKKIFE